MIENILGAVLVGFTVIINLTFINSFVDTHKPPKNIIICGLLLCVCQIITSIAFKEYIAIKIIATIMECTIASVLVFKINLRNSLLLNILFSGVFSAIEMLSFLSVQTIIGTDYTGLLNANGAFFIEIISLLLVMIVIIIIKIIFSSVKMTEMSISGWFIFLLFPLFSIIVTVALITSSNSFVVKLMNKQYTYIGVGLLFINILMFYLLKNIVERERKINIDRVLIDKAENINYLFISLSEEREKQKSYTHDYRKHMEVLLYLVENGKTEEQISYIKNIINDDIALVDCFDTGNQIINAVVNYKFSEASKKGIVFPIVSDSLTDITINNNDIVVILSNLIDNAIEAVENSNDKKIVLKMKIKNEKLYIDISNSYIGKRLQIDKLISSKGDKKNHGYGLENVRRITLQNNGEFFIDTKNNIFHVIVSIPLR